MIDTSNLTCSPGARRLARVIASVALGRRHRRRHRQLWRLGFGARRADPAPPGTAASQLSVLQNGPVDAEPARGRLGRSRQRHRPTPTAVRLLGSNADGLGVDLYALGARQRRCVQRARQREGHRRHDLRRRSPGDGHHASNAVGCGRLGALRLRSRRRRRRRRRASAARPQPATMLPNAYAADLGAVRPEQRHGPRRAPRRRHDRDRWSTPASSRLVTRGGGGRTGARPRCYAEGSMI